VSASTQHHPASNVPAEHGLPANAPAGNALAGHGPAEADTLAAELRVSLMKSARRLRAQKSDAELTDAQFSALAMLDRHGPSTPTALAELEHVSPPSMTRTLAALTERGLVHRTTHPADGRQVIVELTPPGTAAVRQTRARRNAWLSERLSELSDGDRAVLASASQILRRIAAS
jgi:DNA-binding MarR family transcriptional regulator